MCQRVGFVHAGPLVSCVTHVPLVSLFLFVALALAARPFLRPAQASVSQVRCVVTVRFESWQLLRSMRAVGFQKHLLELLCELLCRMSST